MNSKEKLLFVSSLFVSTLGSMSYIYHSGYGYSTRLCKSVALIYKQVLSQTQNALDIIHRGMKREGCVGYCDTTGGGFAPVTRD